MDDYQSRLDSDGFFAAPGQGPLYVLSAGKDFAASCNFTKDMKDAAVPLNLPLVSIPLILQKPPHLR